MSLERFSVLRSKIVETLVSSGINEKSIAFSKDTIPKTYPSAIIVLENEEGKNGTSKRFTDSEFQFLVFLIVSAHNIADPDLEIMTLKETFREQFKAFLGRDFPKVEFYNARADASRKVKIAKVFTRLI